MFFVVVVVVAIIFGPSTWQTLNFVDRGIYNTSISGLGVNFFPDNFLLN